MHHTTYSYARYHSIIIVRMYEHLVYETKWKKRTVDKKNNGNWEQGNNRNKRKNDASMHLYRSQEREPQPQDEDEEQKEERRKKRDKIERV